MNLLIRWLLNALALWLTVQLDIGVSLANDDLGALLVSALILGLVNAIVRPIMVILTLPLTVMTLGLFLLVVNALALAIVAAITPVQLSGFGGAILGALVLTIISTVLSRIFQDGKRR